MDKCDEISMNKTAKNLAIVIYDFLIEERNKKTGASKKTKRNLDRAVECLEKVYKIRFTDYILLKYLYPLPDVFAFGRHPVEVKRRIKAEKYKRKGNSYMHAKLYDSAEVAYTKAISLNPFNAIYYCNRAASRIWQEFFVAAIPDCNKALELDKNYTKAHIWLGLAHAMTNHPSKAIRCYRKALRIEPGNIVCIANMDLINKKLNRSAFRVLEPLYRYSRNLVQMAINIANNQVPFKLMKETSKDRRKNEKNLISLCKFSLGPLD